MFRTELAIEKTRDQISSMHKLMFRGVDNAPDLGDMSDTGIVNKNLWLASRSYDVLSDLKPVLIKNLSAFPFITSDSPAIATNRLFLQKFRSHGFGLGQSGVILVLPIDPFTAVLFYDSDVYAVNGKKVTIDTKRDVDALNRLIVLEARQNIYFRGNIDGIRDFVREIRTVLKPRWHSHAVYARPLSDSDAYERIPDDHREEGSTLYVSSVHYPNPQSWLSHVKYRHRMVGYTNGSAVGYVRRHTAAVDGHPVWKVNLSQAKNPPSPIEKGVKRWQVIQEKQ